jgi:hypothetical protein
MFRVYRSRLDNMDQHVFEQIGAQNGFGFIENALAFIEHLRPIQTADLFMTPVKNPVYVFYHIMTDIYEQVTDTEMINSGVTIVVGYFCFLESTR